MLIRSILTVAIYLACVTNVVAAPKPEVEWRFSHFLPASHSLSMAMADWAKRLGQATNGRINVTVFPAGQLGSGFDHYDMVRTGVAHLAWVVPGYEQGRFPVFSVLETPFLISDASAGVKAFYDWYPRYADIEMDDVVACMFTSSPPGRLNFKNRKVQVPEDLQGARIRVANASVGRYVRNMGGVTINVAISEARHALERGMMDGMPFGFYTLEALSLGKALKVHLDMPFSSSPAIIGLRKADYQQLPADLKATVDTFCSAEESSRLMTGWLELEAASFEAFKNKPGHEIYQVSDDKKRQWLAKADPLIEEWKVLSKKKGLADPEQALLELRTFIRKHGAEVTIEAPPADVQQPVEEEQ